MKKLLKPIIMFLIVILITSCSKNNLDFKDQEINIYLYETYVVEFKKENELTYEILGSNILTIDENGEVFTHLVGQTDVLVKGDSKTITLTFIVLEPRITIENNKLVKYHNDQEFYLNAEAVDDKELEYTSLNPTTVLVNDLGRVTSTQIGSGVIRINLKTNKKIFIDVTIYVISKLELTVSNNSFSIIKNFIHKLDYETTDPFGLTITCSDEEVLTVTNDGIITPKNVGQATVTLMSNYDDNIVEKLNIKVINMSEIIPVLENKTSNLSLNSTVLGVNFKSNNEEIFKVDQFGNVEAVSKGEADLNIQSNYTDEVLSVSIHVLNQTDYLLAKAIKNTNELTNYTFNIGISQIIEQKMVYNSVNIYFDYNKIMFSHINKEEYFIKENGNLYHYYKEQGINRKEIIEDSLVDSFLLTELFNYKDFVYFDETKDYALINMESIELFNNFFGEHDIIRLRLKIKNDLIDKISFTLLVDDEFIYVDITYSDLNKTIVEVPNYD